jgi:hypothetical protein
MNSISAISCRSKYAGGEHLIIQVDGEPLDVVVAKLFPDLEIEGLVPTLLHWLSDEEERAIVWQRARPVEGTTANLPVLMCPDDADLYCTVVVAEVEVKGQVVIWHRIGLDRSPQKGFRPADIGKVVNWATGFGPFVFDSKEYDRCLATFYSALEEKV